MGMAHQRLDRPEIIPSIQQSRGKCVSFFFTDLMMQSTDLYSFCVSKVEMSPKFFKVCYFYFGLSQMV